MCWRSRLQIGKQNGYKLQAIRLAIRIGNKIQCKAFEMKFWRMRREISMCNGDVEHTFDSFVVLSKTNASLYVCMWNSGDRFSYLLIAYGKVINSLDDEVPNKTEYFFCSSKRIYALFAHLFHQKHLWG